MGGNSKVHRAKLSDLVTDTDNANLHTERGVYMVNTSLSKLGAGRSILIDKNNRIIAGNLTTEQAADVGLENVVIVDTDGNEVIAVRRTDMDLNDPETGARQMAYADNRAADVSIDFGPEQMKLDLDAGLDLGDWWFDFELEEMGVMNVEPPGIEGMSRKELLDFIELPLPEGVPDTLWPTDNEWGIPLLDITRQADAFDLPIETWGAKKRGTKAGTLHFYTEDYRFNAIWQNPAQVLKARPINAVEPNFSVYDQVPRVVALWQTYKKRWLARYWQSQGTRIFVDLNVARPYDDLNLLGVPKGWQAFATRGYQSRLQALDVELQIAKAHAETDSVTFLVYGGGEKVKDWCGDNGVTWVPEDMDRAKGKYLESMEVLEGG